MKNGQYKRRNRLPNPSLQMRLIGSFASLCALALLAQLLILGAQFLHLSGALPNDSTWFGEALPPVLLRCLALSLLVLLPLVMLIGVRITFRIAGPLYRMEQHLRAVANGEQPGTCRIRKNDHLQEFCGLLNQALEQASGGSTAPDTDQAARERESALTPVP